MFKKGVSARFDPLLPGKSSLTTPDLHHGMLSHNRLPECCPVLYPSYPCERAPMRMQPVPGLASGGPLAHQ